MSQNKVLASRDMAPLPDSIGPIFFKNQFRTKINLPTKEQYPNVGGKCAIITGSNTGLGLESARQLLSLGLSHLIMGVRSIQKGNVAAKQLRTTYPKAKVEVWQLDMESYSSVQAFAQHCQDGLTRIDFVVLNAGLAPLKFETVLATGHEKTMQVNHFSTMLLTILMIPILKRKSSGLDSPRLTIINSLTAHLSKFENRKSRPLLSSFDDINAVPWDGQERYAVSKLIGQIFLSELTKKVDSKDVIINMVDPGLTKGTELFRQTTGMTAVAMSVFLFIAGRPVDRGAATYVDALLSQGFRSHGCFLMNCDITPLARWYYTEGEDLTTTVWKETIAEFDFVDVVQLLKMR